MSDPRAIGTNEGAPRAAPPFLEVRGLTKDFEVTSGGVLSRQTSTVKAVDQIEFSIDRGETLALVGESGCGKTTTTRMILRLEDPTDGAVLIEGRNIHQLRGQALRTLRTEVQAVFQDPWSSLNPRMRVRDIIAEPLICTQSLSRPDINDRVARVMQDVGLRPEQARNFPHEFSGGQRQRIAIAAALISNPKLIVLDEPVSALDVSIRAQIMNLLKDIQRSYNVTYLLVAHDLATTRYMADWIGVMYLGRLVELARTEDIFTDPKHPYTRALFSAALPAHPDQMREEIVLQGEVPSPLDPPSGCHFHPRCPERKGPECETMCPSLIRPGESDHRVACHWYPLPNQFEHSSDDASALTADVTPLRTADWR